MEIIWYGQSCFLLKSSSCRIVTDPYSPECGLKLPKKLIADIVTISHEHSDHNFAEAVSSPLGTPPLIIREPGEYEYGGSEIIGISTFHNSQKGNIRGKNTIFLFYLENLCICHLGDIGHLLSDAEMENLNQVDVLLIPVGGKYTVDAKKAVELINQIDPKIIVPMHFRIEGLAPSIQIDGVEAFLKELGSENNPLDFLRVSKDLLPAEEKKIVVLKKRD